MANKRIGVLRRDVDAAGEYLRLAAEDESAAKTLMQSGFPRHAVYFTIQAMEKYVRGKIFSLVDPKNEYFRNAHRNHSVEEAVTFLCEVISVDGSTKDAVRSQLETYVLAGSRYERIHNDVRYPFYQNRLGSYCCLEIGQCDAAELLERLNWLKQFLNALTDRGLVG